MTIKRSENVTNRGETVINRAKPRGYDATAIDLAKMKLAATVTDHAKRSNAARTSHVATASARKRRVKKYSTG